MTASEQWRPVVGHPGYEVSDRGRVRSLDRFIDVAPSRQSLDGHRAFWPGQMLRPGLASNGYLTVHIDRLSIPVQWLVAAAFIGPRPPGKLVLHGDGNRTNNRADNLRYGTHIDNAADSAAHGTRVRGEAYTSAKLTDYGAGAIRALRGRWTQAELAGLFSVSAAAVQAVHDGRTWTHAPAMTPAQAIAWIHSFGPAGTVDGEIAELRRRECFHPSPHMEDHWRGAI